MPWPTRSRPRPISSRDHRAAFRWHSSEAREATWTMVGPGRRHSAATSAKIGSATATSKRSTAGSESQSCQDVPRPGTTATTSSNVSPAQSASSEPGHHAPRAGRLADAHRRLRVTDHHGPLRLTRDPAGRWASPARGDGRPRFTRRAHAHRTLRRRPQRDDEMGVGRWRARRLPRGVRINIGLLNP